MAQRATSTTPDPEMTAPFNAGGTEGAAQQGQPAAATGDKPEAPPGCANPAAAPAKQEPGGRTGK
jgi:hypothetical protein